MKRTNRNVKKIVPVVAATLALGMTAGSAYADYTTACIQNVYQGVTGSTQALNCTANDVKLGSVTNITPYPSAGSASGLYPDGTNKDGSTRYKCYAGTQIHFNAVFGITTNASARYDIGLYVANIQPGSNQTDAKIGTCNNTTITNANALTTYWNYDTSGNGGLYGPTDSCGDISTLHNNQQVYMQNVTAACLPSSSGLLNLPNCTSWLEKEKTACTDIAGTGPGAPSKCNCSVYQVPIDVDPVFISVDKSVVTPASGKVPVGTATDVTYQVTVQNLGNALPATLSAITDAIGSDPAVDITYTHDNIKSTNCSLATIAAGGSYQCTFTVSGVTINPPVTSLTDQVCATASNGNGAQTKCGTATVGSELTPSLVKSVLGTVCAVMKYQVQVTNNDPAQSFTLSALTDSPFGDLTKDKNSGGNANLFSTTCGNTAGALPVTLNPKGQAGDTYTCTFNGYACPDASGHINDTVTGTVADSGGIAPASQPSGSAQVTVDNSGAGGTSVTLKVTTP